MELQRIHTQFENLVCQLTNDADIQKVICKTAEDGKACIQKYQNMMVSEGTAIIVQSKLLATATSPDDVNVRKMGESLKAISDKLADVRKDVIVVQGEVHSDIETCKNRKGKHESEIITNQDSITKLEGEIRGIDEEIKQGDTDSANFISAAQELDNRANDIDNAARKKRKRGKWGKIGAIAGVALAPFTGGASLTLTAAGAVVAGVNTNDAGDCRRRAGKLREDANARRQESENLKSKKISLEGQKTNANDKITQLKSSIDRLDKAATDLENMTTFLKDFIRASDNALEAFQHMDTSFKDAQLDTSAFKIIQNAFSKKPQLLEGKAQEYLEQLQIKWNTMQSILVHNGAIEEAA